MKLFFTLATIFCFGASARAQPSGETSELRGRVIDSASQEPIQGATIRIALLPDADTTSAQDGRFALQLPMGAHAISVIASGYLEQTVSVEMGPDGYPELEVLMFEVSQFSESVEVRAAGTRLSEPTAVEVEPTTVMTVAGSLDNVFRTIQTLPGVAATEDFGSRMSVRGGEPDQNLTLMDGVEVHNPYRLFGLTSAFNPETVDNFELTAGGFGAKYGDRLSSLLIVENRSGDRAERLSGSTAASITDANVILEGGLPESLRGAWLVTARRTYYDLVADRIVDENLPSFADLQANLNLGVGGSGNISFFALRSRENSDFSFDDEGTSEFGALLNDAGNDMVSATYDTAIGFGASSRTILSWYRNRDFLDVNGRIQQGGRRSNAPDDEASSLSDIEFDRLITVEDLALRQDFTILAGRHFLETGFEFHRLETGLRFEALGDRNDQEANGSSVRGGAGLPDFLDSSLAASRVGVWLQDQLTISSRFSITPGLRFDWSETNDNSTLSPRFSAAYLLDPKTRIKAAVGLYTQSPGYEKLIQSDYFIDLTDASALDLVHERSTHFIAGFERDVSPGLSARVEGFYKSYDDLIVGRLETNEERFLRVARYDFPIELWDSIPTERIITSNAENQAKGTAYGFDLYLAKLATSKETKLTGWLSYTWTRAERDAYDRRYAFDYDRRHSLNIVGSYDLSRTWTLALTGRLASGFPYTPTLGVRVAATEDPEDPVRLIPATDAEGRYVYTIDLGGTNNLNNARLPFYARIDLRATWRPGGDDGRFALYFEVINLLNRSNAVRLESQLQYNPEGDVPNIVEVPTEGFPFLPTFGFRWRF